MTVIDHPLVQVKLTQLRDARTGSDDFRARVAELATLMVFEATRDLATRAQRVQTPLAEHEGASLARPIIVAPILRAGLGMLEGMLRLLPDVSVAHIGMFRDETTHRPQSYYFKAPARLPEADVLVLDPMERDRRDRTVERARGHGDPICLSCELPAGPRTAPLGPPGSADFYGGDRSHSQREGLHRSGIGRRGRSLLRHGGLRFLIFRASDGKNLEIGRVGRTDVAT